MKLSIFSFSIIALLGYQINPFLLGKESIVYGLVKARMRDGGVFVLDSIIKIKNSDLPEPEANKFSDFTIKGNPFFQ